MYGCRVYGCNRCRVYNGCTFYLASVVYNGSPQLRLGARAREILRLIVLLPEHHLGFTLPLHRVPTVLSCRPLFLFLFRVESAGAHGSGFGVSGVGLGVRELGLGV